MADPAPVTPFPEGDPRNARYFETLAALEHSYQHSIAEGAEARSRAKTNAEYATGQIGKAEPEGFRNLRNRANSEGLLQSGVLAGRTGGLTSQYATKRYGITHGLQETEGRLTRGEQVAKERLELGRTNATNRALEERKQWLLENPNIASDIAGSPGGVLPTAATRSAAASSVANPNTNRELDEAGTKLARQGSQVPTARIKARQPITPRVRRAAARKMFTGGTKAP